MGGPFPDNFPRYQLSGEITGRLVPGGHYRIPVHWKLSALGSSGHGPTKRVNEWPRSPGEMNSQLIDGKPGNGTRRAGVACGKHVACGLTFRFEYESSPIVRLTRSNRTKDDASPFVVCRWTGNGTRPSKRKTSSQPTAVRKIGHVFHSLTLLAAGT